MQLSLHTPKPVQAVRQAPETRPAAVAAGLDALAGKEPEEAAQRLVAELGRLNRSELDADLRARLAGLYEPVARRLIEELLASLPENGTPQSALHRQAANLAYELAVELAYAWKLVNLALQDRRTLFGGARARQQALVHLLAALAGQITTSYRSYTAPPLYSWHELHQLYAAAAEEGIDGETQYARQSPAALYTHTLLLALADPYRFTRPEIEATLAYLDRFGTLARLGKEGKRDKSVFVIDSGTDSPARLDADGGARASLTLDTRALCKHLRSLVVKLQGGEAFRDLGLTDSAYKINGLHLLNRLYQAWRGGNKRAFKRYEPGLSHVEAVSGLPAIHRLFEAEAGAADSEADPARWRVINDSANGLAISAHAQEVAQVRMGCPLALREQNAQDAAWLLGVIRWGKMSKGQVVVAGVEKLSPDAFAVVLRFAEGPAAKLGQPALLLPANPVLQTGERLLLPPGLYQRGRVADLWHKGERRRIGFGSLIEQTTFFDIVEPIPVP